MQISIVSYNIEGLTLEINYCHEQQKYPAKDGISGLKEYIIHKSKCLNYFLSNLDVDIICIQEYTPILSISLDDYYCVIENTNAIFYSKKFKYDSHMCHKKYGLILSLKLDGINFFVCTHRFPSGLENAIVRKDLICAIDKLSKNKVMILAADTNIKNYEHYYLNNLNDCYHEATEVIKTYSYDKTINPYFAGDMGKTIRQRYDRIYISDVFHCEKISILIPSSNDNLKHDLYPYGNLSDHLPVYARLIL